MVFEGNPCKRPNPLNKKTSTNASLENAEITKYAANAFLAMKITFINEVANLCEIVGGDVQDVARAVGLDNRIGAKFLHPGPGFGGSCFPKDEGLCGSRAEAWRPAPPCRDDDEVNEDELAP